ncbi:MAG: sirohydrochlorin cobaltochelatase [Lachnospiraceae bacterium]|nr:sirohydrochlorin cobaltochelatase [Lachnospiraceae bacterium]
MSKLKKRILALGMALVMTLTMIPVFASAALADEAPTAIKVELTVSNQGELAKANDDTVMGQKEVTVTDLNEDGKFTFDEALVAAHAAYNSPDGYTVSSGTVKKLWGVETTNTLFFTNGKGLSEGVTADTIQDGDVLLASINKDNTYWSDWYTEFDQQSVEATYGDDVTLVLTGYQGMMSYMSPEMAPVAGVTIKTADGAVLGTTDESGAVTFQTPAAGEYIVTAEGTVEGTVADWNLMNYKTMDGTVDGTAFVKYDWTTYDTFVAYTDEDYGDGPYPADEVKFIPMFDDEGEDTEWESLHYLKSNQLLADCPIMATASKLTVITPLERVLAAIGELSNDPRDFTAADKEKVEAIQAAYEALSAEDQATVDSTFNHPSGDGQSYGRVLEAALWAVRSFDTDTSTLLADGTYTTVTSESSKGKSDSSRVRNWWVESVEVAGGKATAKIYVTSGAATASKVTSYPTVWLGGESYAIDSNHYYYIPVDLNGTNYFGGVSSSMPRPIMYALNVEIAEPVGISNITNNTGMFNAVSASYMMNADGSATLTMALSGTGYKELYKGTFDQAVANGDGTADKGNDRWIHGYTNAAGKLEFQIPIAADEIGKVIPLVAVSNSYYTKYLNGQNDLARAFYPRQIELDTTTPALETGDADYYETFAVTNNVSMFSVASARMHIVGGPNSNGYKKDLEITMGSTSFGKVALSKARKADDEEQYDIVEKVVVLPVEWNKMGGETVTSVLADGERVTTSWWSNKNADWYERDMTLDAANKTLVFDTTIKAVDVLDQYYDSTKTLEEMKADIQAAITSGDLKVTPGLVDDMIEVIYVQYRDEKTDFYCMATKVLWDTLSDEEKEKVEEYDYYGADTGDASKDDTLNQDEIGKNEILVVSFGTSFNDSRIATIGGIEKAIAEAYPDWSVRRAFTAQIIINHIQSREGAIIDNVEQALERAVANNVETLIVQPTHLMHGAEYDELVEALEPYQDKMTIIVAEPLLGEVGADATIINDDKMAVAEAIVAAACKDAGYTDAAAAAADGAAIVLMGHGTEHVANITYEQMQTAMNKLGYANVFIGTVEGLPESTECSNVIAAVKAAGYKKVFLRPLMVVAGDHANNDMADPEDEESWVSQFTADGSFTSITAQIAGLGEIPAVQQIYVSHVTAVMVEKIADDIEDLPAADDITLDDYEDIMAVKDAFDALSDEDKAKIDPDAVKDLKLAAATVENLKAQEDIAELEEQIAALKEQLAKTPGWHTNDDGSKYYNDANGEKVKGWLKDNDKWYFMDKETGIMATGWVKDGSWYFMKEDGTMATGWVKDGDTWYYMNTSGAMQTGWLKDGNTWYYLKSSGAMAANEWCGGYWLNANGSWTYQPKGSWKQNSTGWWFGDTSGWYAKSTTQKIDGVDYTFNAAGYWVQ